jgi:hypothetical protein
MALHLGHGSTQREKPRKAFETLRDRYSKKIDFGESKIPEGKVYRKRWKEAKSWFWTTVKLLILGFILFVMYKAFTE